MDGWALLGERDPSSDFTFPGFRVGDLVREPRGRTRRAPPATIPTSRSTTTASVVSLSTHDAGRRDREGRGARRRRSTASPSRTASSRRGRAVRTVELRVLEGPNLYFPRPAVKLTLDVAGGSGSATRRSSGSRARPWASQRSIPARAESDQRLARDRAVAVQLTRRIAAEPPAPGGSACAGGRVPSSGT